MSLKKSALVILILGVIIGLLIFRNNAPEDYQRMLSFVRNSAGEISHDEVTSISKLPEKIKKSAVHLSTSMKDEDLTFEQAEELFQWQYDRGYPLYDENGNEYTNGYENYSSKILEQLAQQGEVMLGKDKMLNETDYEGANKYFIEAVVIGNTLALAKLENLNIGLKVSYLNNGDKEGMVVHNEEAYSRSCR